MKTPKLKRREFLKLSALFAAGAPLGAKAWERPNPDDFHRMAPYFARENAWLRREVASDGWTRAKRRIAFAHIPPTYSKPGAKRPSYTAVKVRQTDLNGRELLVTEV